MHSSHLATEWTLDSEVNADDTFFVPLDPIPPAEAIAVRCSPRRQPLRPWRLLPHPPSRLDPDPVSITIEPSVAR